MYKPCPYIKYLSAGEWHWQSIDDSIIMEAIPKKGPKELIANYDLCLTGEVRIIRCVSKL